MLSEDDLVGRKASEHLISDEKLEVEDWGPGLPITQESFKIMQSKRNKSDWTDGVDTAGLGC